MLYSKRGNAVIKMVLFKVEHCLQSKEEIVPRYSLIKLCCVAWKAIIVHSVGSMQAGSCSGKDW